MMTKAITMIATTTMELFGADQDTIMGPGLTLKMTSMVGDVITTGEVEGELTAGAEGDTVQVAAVEEGKLKEGKHEKNIMVVSNFGELGAQHNGCCRPSSGRTRIR